MKPYTRNGWYLLGQRMVEFMCKKVNCGHEPNEQVCKQCLLYLLSDNIQFHYERGSNVFITYVLHWRQFWQEIVNKAIKRLKEKRLWQDTNTAY
jgi:hypothetical protein